MESNLFSVQPGSLHPHALRLLLYRGRGILRVQEGECDKATACCCCWHGCSEFPVSLAQCLGHGFRSWQERQEKFLFPCPGLTFCADSRRYLFHPYVTTVARKRSRSFCQKCRWQVTAKQSCTLCMLASNKVTS